MILLKLKKRNTKTELINGKYYTKKEAAKLSKISYGNYLLKLKSGFNAQEIYEIGANKKHNIMFEGKVYNNLTIESILNLLNIPSLKYNFKKFNDIDLAIDISLLKENKYIDSKGFIHEFKSEYEKELFMNGDFDVNKE